MSATQKHFRRSPASAILGYHRHTLWTRARMAEQGTFVRAILLGQMPAADLAARVRDVPAIPLGHLHLSAKAEVILRHEKTNVPTSRTLPNIIL